MAKEVTLAESVWLYENSYGSAYKISRLKIIGVLAFTCLVTPCTNWIIPFLPKLIKKDYRLRY